MNINIRVKSTCKPDAEDAGAVLSGRRLRARSQLRREEEELGEGNEVADMDKK